MKPPVRNGLPALLGFVTDVDSVTALATIQDSFGKNRTIRTDIRRGAGRIPIVGETWFLDRSLGDWTFAALYSNEVDEPVFASGALPVPIGGLAPFAGAAAPSGWLLCNGASVAVATYAALHAVIGYIFGGAGANFNVPDMRTRFPVGAQAGGDYDLGDVGGAETVTLAEANLPVHSHTISHTHSIDPPNTNTGNNSANHTHSGTSAGHSATHTHGPGTLASSNFYSEIADAALTGAGQRFRSASPNQNITMTSGATGNASVSHTHTLTTGNQSAAHSHTVDIPPFDSAGASAGNSGDAGSGTAHENRPPFLALNYIICAGV